MIEEDLRALVARVGVGAKLVREICRAHGWRHRPGDNGAPREWYIAFRSWLGDAIERVLR